MIRPGWQLRLIPALLLIVLAACAGRYSENPEIALKQKWSDGCTVTDRAINTAWTIRTTLSDAQLQTVDSLVVVYETACTEPPVIGASLQGLAVRVAASRLCPGLAPVDPEDWVLTAIDAANCASLAALRFLEEGA